MKKGDRVIITAPAYYGMTATYSRPGGLQVASGAFFRLENGDELPFDPHEYSIIVPEQEATVSIWQERAEQAELEAQAYRAKMHQQARIAKRKQEWINRGIAEGWITPPAKETTE